VTRSPLPWANVRKGRDGCGRGLLTVFGNHAPVDENCVAGHLERCNDEALSNKPLKLS
jgi:hypothetical protein